MQERVPGTRFHKWTLQDVPDTGHYVLCRCDCGTTRRVYIPLLTSGRSRSCGCTRKTHGLSSHPFYRHWRDMKRRCDTNQPGYENISYPDEWKDFPAFIRAANKFSTRFRRGLTLVRINPLLNYDNSNCDWRTKKQQAENRKSSKALLSRFGAYTTHDWFRILESLRSGKRRATLKTFRAALQYAGGNIDTLLLTVQKTDEQIQEHIREYHRKWEIRTD